MSNRNEDTLGLIQVTGIYKNGDTFIEDKKCPFRATVQKNMGINTVIGISLVVPTKMVDSILAGLESGADLTLDNVPTLVEQS